MSVSGVCSAFRLCAPAPTVGDSGVGTHPGTPMPESTPSTRDATSDAEPDDAATTRSRPLAASAELNAADDEANRRCRRPTLSADAPKQLSRASLSACPHWVAANACRLPHRGERYKQTSPGRLIHADICGPFPPSVPHRY